MAKRNVAPPRQRLRLFVPYSIALFALCVAIAVIVLDRFAPNSQGVESPRAIVAEFDTVKVPVPLSQVPQGTRARDIRIKLVAYPRHQLPPDVIFDVAQLDNAISTSSLPASIPLFRANFRSGAHVGNPVVERIPDGMRAMTVRVDATAAVEGWAGSGALVDVLLIAKNRTRVVAEKVRILSAERSVSPVSEGTSPSVPSTVTLLVTQDQCLAINTAIPLGRIAFALRSSSDEQQWRDPLFTAEQLTGSAAPVRKQAKVSGFISVSGTDTQFALTEGRWVKADGAPSGFLASAHAKN